MFDVFMIKVRSRGISFLKVEFNDQTFTFILLFRMLLSFRRGTRRSLLQHALSPLHAVLRLVRSRLDAGEGFHRFNKPLPPSPGKESHCPRLFITFRTIRLSHQTLVESWLPFRFGLRFRLVP